MGRLFWEILSFVRKPWRSYTIWRYIKYGTAMQQKKEDENHLKLQKYSRQFCGSSIFEVESFWLVPFRHLRRLGLSRRSISATFPLHEGCFCIFFFRFVALLNRVAASVPRCRVHYLPVRIRIQYFQKVLNLDLEVQNATFSKKTNPLIFVV